MTTEWRLRPQVSGADVSDTDVDAVVVPVYVDELPRDLPVAFLAGSGFTGEVGAVLHLPGAAGEPGTVFLGFGARAALTPDTIRTAAGRLARAVRGYPRLALTTPNADIAPLVEGYLLGGYRFTRYRGNRQLSGLWTADDPSTGSPAEARDGLDRGYPGTGTPPVVGGGCDSPVSHADNFMSHVDSDVATGRFASGSPTPLAHHSPPDSPTPLTHHSPPNPPTPLTRQGPPGAPASLERQGAAPQRIDVVVADSPSAQADLERGLRLAGAVMLARDLVNEPGEALTPQAFADRAAEVAAESGLDCVVWDADRIAAERLGGLLGVARGSLLAPRLVKLAYRPPAATRRIALVGKGVTFDAGGLSLKPNAQLADMKADMAGAAAVLGAMSVLSGLDCPVAVDAWLPLTENMPNADPIRVGDVLRMRDGTTVEVRNADAEGRLIMADALVLAGESGPDAIVDIATLTDAAAIALGRRIAAIMGNDNGFVNRVCAAATRAGEPVWPLPLPNAYRPQLDSKVADLVNYTIGTRHGTALLAGLFLREFVPPGTPWAHLDIQGTAWCDTDDGEWVAGGSGFGVRTLVRLLLDGG